VWAINGHPSLIKLQAMNGTVILSEVHNPLVHNVWSHGILHGGAIRFCSMSILHVSKFVLSF